MGFLNQKGYYTFSSLIEEQVCVSKIFGQNFNLVKTHFETLIIDEEKR